jgi:hypothetical protein
VIISPRAADGAGQAVKGTTLVIGDCPAEGTQREVAPLHVHHADDEAWHVVSGALRQAEELDGSVGKVPPGRVAPACCRDPRHGTILPL